MANYSAADIPLETQWLDIDYMDNYKDFTTDKDTFSLQEMVGTLVHSQPQHYTLHTIHTIYNLIHPIYNLTLYTPYIQPNTPYIQPNPIYTLYTT